MVSFTPLERRDELTGDAMNEGLINGGVVLTGMMGVLYGAMRNPTFRKLTNVQSRTAIVIMPALFVFAFSSESRLLHRMGEIANENEHAMYSVEWAERERKRRAEMGEEDRKLEDLFRHSILETSHIRIVPELQVHHKAANYVQSNPFKIIAGIGIPAVGLIYYGEHGKAHLSTQMKVLHTRVFGQFTVICTVLGVLGAKALMDEWGQYATEQDIDVRVQNMIDTRHKMMDRIDQKQMEQDMVRQNIMAARHKSA